MGLAVTVTVMLDLRAALRSLGRSPGFFIGAVLTLGLGLGAVTTAFGLLAGALGESGIGRSAEPVVLYLTERANGRDQRMRWPYAAVEQLRQSAQSFARIATYTTGTLNLTGAGESARVDVEFVSPDYFAVTGVEPVVGRAANAPAEVAISHALWQRVFGATPSVLGQTLNLSREPVTIVGVMPEGFLGISGRAQAFVPHTLAPRVSNADYLTSEEYFHNVIATLKSDVDTAGAQSELRVLAARIATVVPPRSDGATDRSGLLMPLSEARTSASVVRARAYVAAGAVLVLLIAGVNLANLVSIRVAARQREFGVRMAVGAGRLDLARTVGTEMGLVAIGGLALALLLSAWTRDLVLWLVPAGLASAANDYGQIASFTSLQIDGGVTVVVAILALLTMAGASLLATRRSLGGDLVSTLKSSGDRGSTRGPGVGERVLLVVQVAASLGLIASASLVLKSVSALDRLNPGFDTDRTIAFSVAEDLAVQRPGAGPLLVDRLITDLGRLRGVEAITAGQCTPFGSRCARLAFSIEGRPETVQQPLATGWHRVGANHFEALRIPVVRGRGFTSDDRRGRPAVVTINETAARRC